MDGSERREAHLPFPFLPSFSFLKKLPRTPTTLSRPARKKLTNNILPVLLSAILVVHTPSLELAVWEEAARERMESGLEGRERRKGLLEEEGRREDERGGGRG